MPLKTDLTSGDAGAEKLILTKNGWIGSRTKICRYSGMFGKERGGSCGQFMTQSHCRNIVVIVENKSDFNACKISCQNQKS